MSKTRNIRVLLVSVTTILVCIALMIGATYAWLTDSVVVEQHLEAGNLDITLERTYLSWSRLESGGQMKDGFSDEIVDFSEPTERNVFDLTTDVRIVPCTWYEATMAVKNNRAVTFGYWIEVVPTGNTTGDLASQLVVTVTTLDEAGEVVQTVSGNAGNSLAVGSSTSYVGELKANDPAAYFKIKVEFPDLGEANNVAQNQSASFDLIVKAVQIVEE